MVDRYGREYTDPYLGHSIGPVPGYQVRSSLRSPLPSRVLIICEFSFRPCTAEDIPASRHIRILDVNVFFLDGTLITVQSLSK